MSRGNGYLRLKLQTQVRKKERLVVGLALCMIYPSSCTIFNSTSTLCAHYRQHQHSIKESLEIISDSETSSSKSHGLCLPHVRRNLQNLRPPQIHLTCPTKIPQARRSRISAPRSLPFRASNSPARARRKNSQEAQT